MDLPRVRLVLFAGEEVAQAESSEGLEPRVERVAVEYWQRKIAKRRSDAQY
jgi:hypothetical protein